MFSGPTNPYDELVSEYQPQRLHTWTGPWRALLPVDAHGLALLLWPP